jgi:hypothetical protein
MEVIAFFILIMAVPIAVMVCLPPRWRLYSFVLGLVVLWDAVLLEGFTELPPMSLLLGGAAGFLVALASLLVEVPAFAIRTIRKWHARAGAGAD